MSSASGLALTIGMSWLVSVILGEIDALAEIIIGRQRRRRPAWPAGGSHP